MFLRKKNFISWFLLLPLLLFVTELAYGENAILRQEGSLKMAGGTAHIPFMQDLARDLHKKNPKLKILIAGGGSGVGVQQLGLGLIDIANTGRPLSHEEKHRHGLISYPIALDAIVLVVHPTNPLADLSRQKAQSIFSGTTLTWENIPGNKSIHTYVRDEASGTQVIFIEKILTGKKLAPYANFTNSQGAMKLAVSQDPAGIGFLSYGYLDSSVKAIHFDGVKAELKTIQKKSYPLVRELYIHTKKNPSPLVKSFIEYALSPSSAPAIASYGLVPIYASTDRVCKPPCSLPNPLPHVE
ncbi:MAG: phosphate ABC transporter substrate-binding protein [Oligoflexales bacterium]|nr:phosphate ABC transporter substrate-binding protein [Oligoflexales bacterium]